MPGLQLSRIRNLTTGIDMHAPHSPLPLDLVEWGERTLVFQVAARGSVGHLVALEGTLSLGAERHRFEATGKIQSAGESGENLHRFEVLLQQYDRELWARLIQSLKSKQQRADKIFSAIRGEDT